MSAPRGVHLCGSVPLTDTESVMRTASAVLGRHLRRLPDGETAERLMWSFWQLGVFTSTPGLELGRAASAEAYEETVVPRVSVQPGATSIAFGPLGYATASVASYRIFAKLRAEGVIPDGCRFQVALPTPLAPISSFVALEDQPVVEPAYERRMLEEIDEIVDAVGPSNLAIQWDCPIEIAMLEGCLPQPPQGEAGIFDRLVRLGEHVPAEAQLGYHLCYGDYGHKHFIEPRNTSTMATTANRLAATLTRPLDWIHVPVPRDRADDAYFEPLRELHLAAATELYLGLAHYTDGIDGTRRRIEAARRSVSRPFGVSTECGLGRRPPDTIPEILRIQAEVSEPVR